MGANRDTMKKAFENSQSIRRDFHTRSVTIHPDYMTATAIGIYEGMIRIGGKDVPSSGDFYVRLSKKNGKWLIDDASF
jgi:hypothetical protein